MNQGFAVTVSDVTKKEFLHAARYMGSRYFWGLIALVFVVEFCITLVTSDFSTAAILAPVVIVILVPFAYEFLSRRNYKRYSQPLAIEYYFDEKGWRIEMAEEAHVFAWSNTPKMKETSAVFLLFNAPATSNLVPKRLLTKDQQQLIRTWFKTRNKQKG